MAGGSKSQSQPVDKTPEAFKRLQQPFADVIAQLLGFEPRQGGFGGGAGTGGGSGAAGGGSGAFGMNQWVHSASGEGDLRLRRPDEGGSSGPGPASAFARRGGAVQTGGGDRRTGAGGGGFGGSTFPGGPNFQPSGDPNDVLRGIPTHGGPFAAGIAPGEEFFLGQLQAQPFTGPGFGLSRDVLGATAAGAFLPGTEGGGNPFLQSAIEAAQRPTLQGLEETLDRTLPGRFTAAGQFVEPGGSSAFDRAAALATRGVAQELGDIASELSFAGFEAERGRQQEAAQSLPGVNAQEVNTLVTNLQAQALPRLIEQAGIEGGIEAFNRQTQNLLQTLALSQGITQPVIANQSSSKTKPNVVGPGLGALGGGFG